MNNYKNSIYNLEKVIDLLSRSLEYGDEENLGMGEVRKIIDRAKWYKQLKEEECNQKKN